MLKSPAPHPERGLTAVAKTLLLAAVVLTGGLMGAAALAASGAEGAFEVESLELEAALCEHARGRHARRVRAYQPLLLAVAHAGGVARHAGALGPALSTAGEHGLRNGIGAPLRC